jgi:adenylate cyclase
VTSGAILARTARRRIAASLIAANVVGGVVVFVFLSYVLPTSAQVVVAGGNAHRNDIAFAVYLPLAIVAGWWWGLRRAAGIDRWLESDRPPSEHERSLVLGTAMRLLKLHAALWGAALVLFTALNVPDSATLGATIGVTVALSGLMTSMVAYLLAEQLMKPITAFVLAAAPLERPTLPGVRARLVVAWSLGTGVPLLGVIIVGAQVLDNTHITPTRLAVTVVFLALSGFIVGLAAMLIVARSIASPLTALREALQRVRDGEVTVAVPVDDGSEVGLLQAGFNHMVEGLAERERLRDLFGRHVGTDVARQALEEGTQLGGELREASVLFVDIIGSTQLPETHSPEEVVALLNRFFAVVVEVVGEHGGWVNKFEGDAALCIFGAPVALPDAAGHALAAGRALAATLDLPAGIGVSAGKLVAGNVGAPERYEYTVIGAPVNEAARLTELAKTRDDTRLLASADVLEHAERAEAAHWTLAESVELRGMPTATPLAVPVAGSARCQNQMQPA